MNADDLRDLPLTTLTALKAKRGRNQKFNNSTMSTICTTLNRLQKKSLNPYHPGTISQYKHNRNLMLIDWNFNPCSNLLIFSAHTLEEKKQFHDRLSYIHSCRKHNKIMICVIH